MSLILDRPDLIAVRCSECSRWVYDFSREEFMLHDGERIPQRRPPCWNCPKCSNTSKKSPEVGKESELSLQNIALLRAYYEGPPKDRLGARLFGIVRRVLDMHDRSTRVSTNAALQGLLTIRSTR